MLWSAGHAAFVVGGGLRDALIGRPTADWDLATSALPEETAALFDDAVYENRFGTVAVRRAGREYEITTFRSDHDYADFRRPHRVEFTGSIEADLGRRDFTMNALAWGGPSDGGEAAVASPPVAVAPPSVAGAASAESATGPAPMLVDAFGGRADIERRLIRAVGDPQRRFEEDALRIVRAIRFATTLGFTIEPSTMAAIRTTAPLVTHLSGERIAVELDKILAADQPSIGLRLLADTGVLAAFSPDLAGQAGIPQNKIAGDDLWDHTVRTVDASANRPVQRLAALVHDIGKPATAVDGHFYHHERVGADLAAAFLDRLHLPRSTAERVVHLVRQHMFRYEPNWGDAAVRRFLAKIGPAAVDDLLALREADNVGSGVPRDADRLDELRARIAAEVAAGPILDRSALAIDGADLIRELGLAQGPELGRILGALFERVIEEPGLNEPPTLLLLARDMAVRDGGKEGDRSP